VNKNLVLKCGFFAINQPMISVSKERRWHQIASNIPAKDGLNVVELKLLSIVIFEGGVLCLEN